MEKGAIDNNIFIYTLIGVVLLILAVAAAIIGFRHVDTLRTAYLLLPSVPGVASVVLLYRAIKKDPSKWIQYQ